MKRASFGPQGEVTEVEFFEAQAKAPELGALMIEQEKEIERIIGGLPEDLKEQIMKKRRQELEYASSV